MKFTLEDEIRYDFDKSFFWARIIVQDEQNNETKALIGAGANYICDHFHIRSRADITDEHKNQWFAEAVERLKKGMIKLETDKVYYQVDSFSPEGKANGLKFLREEVVP